MASTDFPSKDSPDLYLVVATVEENLAQTNSNSTEWRGALSLEAYLRREDILANQDLTKDGGLTAWMLVHQPQGSSQRKVLCGCESLKKTALVVEKDGKVRDVVAHGVASVFCPPEHRGKGYAGRMITELGKRLETWQAEKGEDTAFSVLYSDIGKQFYAARGWEAFPSAHIALKASESTPSDLPTAKTLTSDDLSELCALDEKLLRTRLSSTTDSIKTRVALIPDARTFAWHFAREDFVATELNGGTYPPFMQTGRGAIVDISSTTRAWCFWTRVWTNPQEESPNTLHILRLAIEDDAHHDFEAATEASANKVKDSQVVRAIAALLRLARSAALQSDMKEVMIWNPNAATLAAARLLEKDSAVVHREKESIASLRWYGKGAWQDVDWVCNEKYGWC